MSSIKSLVTGPNSWDFYAVDRDEFLASVELTDFDFDKNHCTFSWQIRGGDLGDHIEILSMVSTDVIYNRGLGQLKLSVPLNDEFGLQVFEKAGFLPGREFGSGSKRARRMALDRYDLVRQLAESRMAEHLDMGVWTFGFDSAKRRFGLCNYSDQHITVSRYLVDIHTLDETMQVVLHEIAHAISGKRAGHGKKWLATAKALGYRAEKMAGTEIAQETAKFIGVCPNGHEHFRFRKPTKALSCAVCSSRYDKRFLITWSSR